jgi:acyl carrier protein
MTTDIISKAFEALDKRMPESSTLCVYRSGLLDSFDVMQLILEIEMETDKRIDLIELIDGDISVARLSDMLLRAANV